MGIGMSVPVKTKVEREELEALYERLGELRESWAEIKHQIRCNVLNFNSFYSPRGSDDIDIKTIFCTSNDYANVSPETIFNLLTTTVWGLFLHGLPGEDEDKKYVYVFVVNVPVVYLLHDNRRNRMLAVTALMRSPCMYKGSNYPWVSANRRKSRVGCLLPSITVFSLVVMNGWTSKHLNRLLQPIELLKAAIPHKYATREHYVEEHTKKYVGQQQIESAPTGMIPDIINQDIFRVKCMPRDTEVEHRRYFVEKLQDFTRQCVQSTTNKSSRNVIVTTNEKDMLEKTIREAQFLYFSAMIRNFTYIERKRNRPYSWFLAHTPRELLPL